MRTPKFNGTRDNLTTIHLHQSSEASMSTFTPNELTYPFTPPAIPFTPPAIEVAGLTKTYGEVEAVRGVSFTVARGEVFGFLGPDDPYQAAGRRIMSGGWVGALSRIAEIIAD
jgi:hypothetical protein